MNTIRIQGTAEAVRSYHATMYALQLLAAQGVVPGHIEADIRCAAFAASDSAARLVVLQDDKPAYSFPADEPARNEYGRETGYTWGQEFTAGRLYVGQADDGDAYGQMWAQSALPEPTITRW